MADDPIDRAQVIRRGGITMWFDNATGQIMRLPGEDDDTSDMGMPARCNCGKVYDASAQPTVARYADCSVWRCPGCGVMSDDRRFVHQPYRRLPGRYWGEQ